MAEQDSLLAKEIWAQSSGLMDSATALLGAWVTTLAQRLRLAVCVTAKALVMGGID